MIYIYIYFFVNNLNKFNIIQKKGQIFRLATVSTSIGSLKYWEVMMIYDL